MAPRKIPGITPRRNADGTTSYRIRWRQEGDGPQLSHTYGRQAEAVDALAQIRVNGNVCLCREHRPADRDTPLNLLDHVEREGIQTFGVYAAAHIDALTGVGVGYRTRFHREVRRHLAPFLTRPLADITVREVKVWIRGCEEGEHPWLIRRVPHTDEYAPYALSPTTIRRLLVQAGSVMGAAQEEGLVRKNPFRGHRIAQREEDQSEIMRMITPTQWKVLRAELAEGTARDLCTVLVTSGLRFSEATALRIGDVDRRAGQLHVRQAWVADDRSGRTMGTPKSAGSRRVVSVGPSTMAALLPHLFGGDDELVFRAPRGGPIVAANFHHRVWAPALDRAALSHRPRVHDLRHSYASWALGNGVPLIDVSRALGHASVQVTAMIYSHVSPEAAGRMSTAIEQALEGEG